MSHFFHRRSRLLSPVLVLAAFLLGGVAGGQVTGGASPDGGSAARVTVDVRPDRSAARAGDTLRAAVLLDIEDGWHANAHDPGLDYLIGTELTVESPPELEVVEVRYPEAEQYEFSFADGQALSVYSGRSPVVASIRVASEADPGRYVLDGTLRIQICNDEVCLRPSTVSVAMPLRVAGPEEEVERTGGPWLKHLAEGKTERHAGREEVAVGGVEARITSMFEQRALLFALLGVLVIGLALNLTPCVYPMLSVTVSLFGAGEGTAEDGDLGRSFGRAVAYVGGMVTIYAVLGTAAAYTGGLFGSWLQSPWVLGGIGVLLLGLAYGMLGGYQLRVPESITGRLQGVHEMSGFAGLYLSGGVVGLFAAPCVGPPIVGLLAFVGARGDPFFGLSIFGTLGFGLGLPYLVFGTFSGLLHRLPRSGVWMVWVERLFGVVMVGAALFFLALAVMPGRALYAVPITLVGGGAYLGFIWGQEPSSRLFRRIRWALGTLAVVAGVAGFAFLQKPTIDWQPYAPEALEAARRADEPVLLDFYADWCVPCLELDRITFADRRVIEATGEFARVKVDLTRYDSPEAEAVRQKFDVAGVPTLVFLDGSGEEIPNSRIVGYIGPDVFLEHLRSVRADRSAR